MGGAVSPLPIRVSPVASRETRWSCDGSAMTEARARSKALAMASVGPWQIEPANGLLRRGAETRSLEPKAMAVLTVLLRHSPETVSREDLFAEVWPDTAISDGALTRCVRLIRVALGDDARNPRWLHTVPRRGYRLICPHPSAAPAAKVAQRRSGVWTAVAGSMLVVLVAWLVRSPDQAPLVVVEAFEDLGPEAQSLGLAAGLEASLLAELSTRAEVRVARPGAKRPDLVVAGSARADGGRAHFACQAYARDGELACAETCRSPSSDWGRLQERASERLADSAVELVTTASEDRF